MKVKISEVCEQIRGVSYKPSDVLDSLTGIPILRANNISDGTINYDNLVYIKKERISSKQILKKGDILICTSSGSKNLVGKAGLIEKDVLISSFGAFCRVLRAHDISSEYLFHYFCSNAYKNRISSLSEGANINNIRNEHINVLEIPIYPLEEEKKLLKVLNVTKSLILRRKQQLTKLNELAKSRFLEMFGDPILNPMGWAISHYGDEFEIMSGGTPKTDIPEYWVNGKISWIGSNLCQNSVLIENDGKFITEKGLNNSSAKIFNKGYILIALVGATIGKVAHLKFSTSTNQNIAGINVPQNENYIPEFVFYNTQFLYPKFMDIGNSKFKMANLSFIRSLQIPIVPIKAQKKFSNFVEQLDKSKFRAKKCLKLFTYMRHLRIIGI